MLGISNSLHIFLFIQGGWSCEGLKILTLKLWANLENEWWSFRLLIFENTVLGLRIWLDWKMVDWSFCEIYVKQVDKNLVRDLISMRLGPFDLYLQQDGQDSIQIWPTYVNIKRTYRLSLLFFLGPPNARHQSVRYHQLTWASAYQKSTWSGTSGVACHRTQATETRIWRRHRFFRARNLLQNRIRIFNTI